jgi:hypothetical protein
LVSEVSFIGLRSLKSVLPHAAYAVMMLKPLDWIKGHQSETIWIRYGSGSRR